jgi:tryptophanyl-tRNA synthetase
LYTDEATVEKIDRECRKAEIGCVACKKIMAASLIDALAPLQEKRRYYTAHPEIVDQIIADGSAKACAIAKDTMAQVKAALKMNY